MGIPLLSHEVRRWGRMSKINISNCSERWAPVWLFWRTCAEMLLARLYWWRYWPPDTPTIMCFIKRVLLHDGSPKIHWFEWAIRELDIELIWANIVLGKVHVERVKQQHRCAWLKRWVCRIFARFHNPISGLWISCPTLIVGSSGR